MKKILSVAPSTGLTPQALISDFEKTVKVQRSEAGVHGGVLFLKDKLGAFLSVLKLEIDPELGVFASKLATLLGLSTPSCLVVSTREKSMKSHFKRIQTLSPGHHIPNELLAMEFVKGKSFLDFNISDRSKFRGCMEDFGRLIVFDFLIHNGDRLSLYGSLNPGNMMCDKLTQRLVVIDQEYQMEDERSFEKAFIGLLRCFHTKKLDGFLFDQLEALYQMIGVEDAVVKRGSFDIQSEDIQHDLVALKRGLLDAMRRCSAINVTDLSSNADLVENLNSRVSLVKRFC